MSNSLGTLAGSLILQRALELVTSKRPLLKNITLGTQDLDGQAVEAKKGQPVITRIKSLPAVGDFGDPATAFNTTDVPVTLTAEKQIHLKFTRSEIESSDRNFIDETAGPIAEAIANYFVGQVAALWTIANFANYTNVASGWSYSNTLLPLKAALDTRKAGSRRFFAHSTAVNSALLNDSLIVAESNNAANGAAIQRGELPVVAGFGLEHYTDLPNTGNMVGFAGTPDSTLLAVRPHRNPEDIIPGLKFPGNFGHIQDAATGLTLAVSQWIESDLSVNTRLSWIQGIAVGKAANGHILRTATPA